MNRARTIFVTLVISGLTACASQPAQDNYYSLMLATEDVTMPVSDGKAKGQLIVGPIRLASYLTQPGLAIQIGRNQIQMANHHFWAEPLDEAIAKVLVRDISQTAETLLVDRDAGQWTAEGDCRLRVEFDTFHATDDSRVVAAGRYWVHQRDRSRPSKNAFDIVRPLTTDGYAHAVHQLRASLDTLAKEMLEHMQATSACSLRAPD